MIKIKMEDISLHILDIVENSINADANKIFIALVENTKKNFLKLIIKDNGRGIDKKILDKITDPFFTTRKTRRIGLGIPLLQQSVEEAEGNLKIKSKIGKGTSIIATFKLNHIDRKPLGDLGETLITLIAGNSNIDFVFIYKKDGKIFKFSTENFEKELFRDPQFLRAIKEYIKGNLNDMKITF